MPKNGDHVRYKALAGDVCDAVVVGVRLNNTVDLDVNTGSKDPLHLTGVPVVDAAALERGTCACIGGGDGTDSGIGEKGTGMASEVANRTGTAL